jgi:hypothetical protein
LRAVAELSDDIIAEASSDRSQKLRVVEISFEVSENLEQKKSTILHEIVDIDGSHTPTFVVVGELVEERFAELKSGLVENFKFLLVHVSLVDTGLRIPVVTRANPLSFRVVVVSVVFVTPTSPLATARTVEVRLRDVVFAGFVTLLAFEDESPFFFSYDAVGKRS